MPSINNGGRIPSLKMMLENLNIYMQKNVLDFISPHTKINSQQNEDFNVIPEIPTPLAEDIGGKFMTLVLAMISQQKHEH